MTGEFCSGIDHLITVRPPKADTEWSGFRCLDGAPEATPQAISTTHVSASQARARSTTSFSRFDPNTRLELTCRNGPLSVSITPLENVSIILRLLARVMKSKYLKGAHDTTTRFATTGGKTQPRGEREKGPPPPLVPTMSKDRQRLTVNLHCLVGTPLPISIAPTESHPSILGQDAWSLIIVETPSSAGVAPTESQASIVIMRSQQRKALVRHPDQTV
ncbi:hypothetical protein CMUS01_10172 [Colletotrichum musicola]|uniref:Uncharacterized protein n=1 Tax=Colletotrichum musicola TaxID=2175873 RepID=A0A8H6K493_9PEZI|nr:hypothetical protein CMUS01_10172 [Colletotrichum musicola]